MYFRQEASLDFHTYFGQCSDDTYILLQIPLDFGPKQTTYSANDCHSPQRPLGGFSGIANGLFCTID